MRRASVCGLMLLFGQGVLLAEEPKPSMSEATALYQQAVAAYEAKDYDRSIELCLQSLKGGAKTGIVPYYLACCHALTDKPNEAFKYLNMAIERGWRDVEHLKVDADLVSLHTDARWEAAVKSCEASRDKARREAAQQTRRDPSETALRTSREPELARELLHRMAIDQRARMAIMEKQRSGSDSVFGLTPATSDELNLMKIDKENTVYMKTVVEKYGWPGRRLVGEEASRAAWLLVQHADLDPEFQAKCLDLIKEAYKTGDATGQDVAYLTDRVLLKQGKKQLYGTQFMGIGADVKPRPIEDEANLDSRRKEMGLGTMAEYEKFMKGSQGNADSSVSFK